MHLLCCWVFTKTFLVVFIKAVIIQLGVFNCHLYLAWCAFLEIFLLCYFSLVHSAMVIFQLFISLLTINLMQFFIPKHFSEASFLWQTLKIKKNFLIIIKNNRNFIFNSSMKRQCLILVIARHFRCLCDHHCPIAIHYLMNHFRVYHLMADYHYCENATKIIILIIIRRLIY